MNKNRKLDVLVIMLFIVEILIVKHFYQTEELFHFRSLFWGFHELVTLIFLGISYIFLHEDIGYYDVFLILFPLIGISLLLLERIFQKWKVSNAVIDELLSSGEQEEKKEDAPLKYFHELPEEMQEKFAKIGQNSTKIPAFLPKKATEEMSYEKHRREIQKTMEKEK